MSLPPEFLSRPLAHRGLHDVAKARPENSRAAVTAAIDAGYGIEIDVQLSSDGAAMVFHDYTLNRLTPQSGPVRLHTANSLRGIALSGGQETIPDLPEVLALISGRAPLLIELKDQDGDMGPDVGPLETAVAYALEDYSGPVAVMSFNPFSVGRMALLAPDVPRGLVTCGWTPQDWDLADDICDRLRDIPDYNTVGAGFISHDAKDLTRPRVADLKQAGASILCWTIRSAEDEKRAREVAHNVTFEGYLPEPSP